MRSNNQAATSATNSGKVKDDFLGQGMQFVHYEMAIRDSKLLLLYVNTKDNIIADRLSRGDSDMVSELKMKGYSQVFVPMTHLSKLMSLDL